jgi:hypothetical protein
VLDSLPPAPALSAVRIGESTGSCGRNTCSLTAATKVTDIRGNIEIRSTQIPFFGRGDMFRKLSIVVLAVTLLAVFAASAARRR